MMLLLSFLLSFVPLFWQSGNGKIVITIEGISAETGTMIVGLFDNPEDFTVTPVISRIRPVKEKGTMVVTLEDVPYKTYAVSIYHDLNDNRKLDKNITGIPREPYGFSNNPVIIFGPSWEKSTFELNEQELKLTIHLK
jgi:uncharacterized protein (DUF2141 family)